MQWFVDHYRELMVSGLLALVTLGVFYAVAWHDFVDFDDDVYVIANETVLRGITAEGTLWAFQTGHAGNWHPLTWLSHMLDSQLYGRNAGGHHVTSLVLHVVNNILLFVALRAMTGDEPSIWKCAFVAALFAVHPVHVESVAWVAERKDVLSTTFWMLTMLAYASYARRPYSWGRYVVVLLMLALGLMSKPMLVTLPLVLLLLDYWPLRRWQWVAGAKGAGRITAKRLVIEKVPLLALAIASSVKTFTVQRAGEAVATLDQFPLRVRLANAAISYVAYLGKTIWPANLSFFYPYSESAWKTPAGRYAEAAAAGALLLAVTVACVMLARRRPYAIVGWLWYLGTLVPVIGLVQVGSQAMADRYTYVPLIGIFIIASWGATDLVGAARAGKVILPVAAATVICACAARTWFQVHHWADSRSLFSHALDVDPDNYLAHSSLGRIVGRAGNLDEAIKHYRRAIEIKPIHSTAQHNLGAALMRQGKLDEAQQCLLIAAQLNPRRVETYIGLGQLYTRQGKLDEAIAAYEKAAELAPRKWDLRFGLANLLVKVGRLDEAARHFAAIVEIKPQMVRAHRAMAVVRAAQGRTDEAIAACRRALAIDPRDARMHGLLGELHVSLRRHVEAVRHYREALRWNADAVEVANNLAWILATSRDDRLRNGREAVEIAERLCQATGHQMPAALDTLAAAYAESHRFADAVRTASQGADLASAQHQFALADEIRGRLKQYEAQQPYRDTH